MSKRMEKITDAAVFGCVGVLLIGYAVAPLAVAAALIYWLLR